MQALPEDSGAADLSCVRLAAAPWPLFNRPSIQLGTLKSYLNRHLPHLEVTTSHFYLGVAGSLGYEIYQPISERTWLAEPVYAAMLYPQRMPELENLFNKYASSNKALKKIQFEKVVNRVKRVSDRLIAAVDWQSCQVVGFTMSLCQLTSTLYFLNSIKQKHPRLTTVVGGSTFSNTAARDYLASFPSIDCIVVGEGERPLLRLLKTMQLEEDSENLRKPLQGVVGRFASEGETIRFNQLEDLTALPPPDFDEYFCTLEGFEPEKRFFPTLPVEASRGCWWRGKDSQGVSRGCAFCNLNLQWKGYRQKKIRQVVREIDELTTRHQVLSIAFVDNVLPHTGSEGLFDGLERLGKDLTLFAETRASTSLEQLRKMRDAGLDQVQVGIESLSSNLLKKMNKGVSVVQNLEIMRNCEALGIRSEGNLILGFPGSDTGDVDQTLRALGHAMAFRPLKPVYFWLGLGSGVWRDYTSFGITSVCNHPHYRILFPVEIEKKCRFVVQSYRGERLYQQKIWKPVLKKIRQWEQQYAELHRDPHAGPILGYRDGRSFLMLYHRRYRSETMRHRLSGASREIYLFCRQNRSLKQIVSKFSEIGTEPLKSFLSMMLVKHLMYEDGGRYLSLAVPMGKTH